MWDDEEEKPPLIPSSYARMHARKCAEYQLTVLARCLQEQQGRVVKMVSVGEITKKYGLTGRGVKDFCVNHDILHEIHVEMIETEEGGESPRLVLYVDKVGFDEYMRGIEVVKPPANWVSLDEISIQWRQLGIYASPDTLRTFCRRQGVQDARIAGRVSVPNRQRLAWYAEPNRLLKMWEREVAHEQLA